MKIYREEPYYEDDQERNFFITLDVLKMFVDPETNEIDYPTLCADVLTIIQPIIKNAEVFKDAIKEPFDPNDVIDCLVNVVWPAFIEHNGGVVPDRPTIEKVHGVGKLPSGSQYDWQYRQLLRWLFDRHEDQSLTIVNGDALKDDLRVYMPIIRSTSVLQSYLNGLDDTGSVAKLIKNEIEVGAPSLRKVVDHYRGKADD